MKINSSNKLLHNYVNWIGGNAPKLDEKLRRVNEKLLFIPWYLRAFGQPVFVNNPWTSLLVIVAFFIENPWVAINALFGQLVALLTAIALGASKDALGNGLATFNGMLTSVVLANIFGPKDFFGMYLLVTLVFAASSVPIASGIANILSHLNLPALTLPFCINGFVYFGLTKTSQLFAEIPKNNGGLVTNGTSIVANVTTATVIDWRLVVSTPLTATAQVYACAKPETGGIILLGMFMSSPLLMIFSVVGAALSTLTAMILKLPLTAIYNGIWGYNSVLTCAAIGGFFYRLTFVSAGLAVAGAVFTVAVQASMVAFFQASGIPVLTFPFVFTTLVIVSVSSNWESWHRVPGESIAYPEAHLKLHRSIKLPEKGNDVEMGTSSDDS